MPRSEPENKLIQTFRDWRYEPSEMRVCYMSEYTPDFVTPLGTVLEVKGFLTQRDCTKIIKVAGIYQQMGVKYVLCPILTPQQMRNLDHVANMKLGPAPRRGLQMCVWAFRQGIFYRAWDVNKPEMLSDL